MTSANLPTRWLAVVTSCARTTTTTACRTRVARRRSRNASGLIAHVGFITHWRCRHGLMSPRFEVRQGRLEFRGNAADGRPIFEPKRVDIMLGVDVVQLAAKGHIQQALLLAGDSDFVPAVAVAKAGGVLVRLYHGDNCHVDLLREVDERVRLDQTLIDSVLR